MGADGRFVSYHLAYSGVDFVFRPSNARPGVIKAISCTVAVIDWLTSNSPVIRGHGGCLGIEAPFFLKAGSFRPPEVLALPALTSRKVCFQGPPLPGWGSQATLFWILQ